MDAFARIEQGYRSIGVPENPTCVACDATDKRPLLPWHVGRSYFDSQPRVVILGKNHRDDRPTKVLPGGIQDGRETAQELQASIGWAYWAYVREILTEVYGDWERGWNRIARSNLVKCTTVSKQTGSTDTTTPKMATSCIRHLGLIRIDLRELEPDLLIVMTGTDYDSYLPDLAWRPELAFSWVDDSRARVSCSPRGLAFSRFVLAGGNHRVLGIRVGHPERKKKTDYVRAVSSWWADRLP